MVILFLVPFEIPHAFDADVSLGDKYTRRHGRIYLSGIQALVRLCLVQRWRDAERGLGTAGFVSGYRGSPLGGVDLQLERAQAELQAEGVRFTPGLNEELALTSVYGSQQVQSFEGARHEGVFGMWYGKAPGLDRAGDALKHANAGGSSRHGGVLLVVGDDHACKSSTLPSQSELALRDAGVPVVSPADIQDVLDFGIWGWELSRFSGAFTGLIALADVMDSSMTVDADIGRVSIAVPQDLTMPEGGLGFDPARSPLEQEALLHGARMDAIAAFARANPIDRVVFDAPDAKLGIVTTGKAHADTRQALQDLGIDGARARELGIRLYKVGLSWPLEQQGLLRFARGLSRILVVEEKRGLIEGQLKEILYGADPALGRPLVFGKRDAQGAELLPAAGALSPARIARAIATQLPAAARAGSVAALLSRLDDAQRATQDGGVAGRIPFYCPGCPHNRSTKVPEGSRALAGIGCHYMALWTQERTATVTQMGGEGTTWIGQAPFTETDHVFINLGDGTYSHSGSLAIRAAVAAGVKATYKILFNDAVAMTGGQRLEGGLTVEQITHQVQREGVREIVVVSDQPEAFDPAQLAPGTRVHHRDEMEAVQQALREREGVSVLIYAQTCAAELRRRRKRGQAPEAPERVFIHAEVCEGCGDCSTQSGCLAIEPVQTALGEKRRIDQTACNKDLSCLQGLCPALVTVEGAQLRARGGSIDPARVAELPAPPPRLLEDSFDLLITGVGGTGVTTAAALLGMAAHLEGKASSALDMTGLAQKGGAVMSHVRFAARPEDLHGLQLGVGSADLLLACDALVGASPPAVGTFDAKRTRAVVNSHLAPTGLFVLGQGEPSHDRAAMGAISRACKRVRSVDASGICQRELGEGQCTNVFMLGYAYQQGLIPLAEASILRAIELNDVAVENNRAAFSLGRLAAHGGTASSARAVADAPAELPLEALIEDRAERLASYQDAAYAERYRALVARVAEMEARTCGEPGALTRGAAEGYHRLLAYKDEYEVARLYASTAFALALSETFEEGAKLTFHLAPPLWARTNPATGRPRKRRYGGWMRIAMRLLSRFKWLRGRWFDPFGHTEERRLERAAIAEYEAVVDRLERELSAHNRKQALSLLRLPSEVRGFGAVKVAKMKAAAARRNALLAELASARPGLPPEAPGDLLTG